MRTTCLAFVVAATACGPLHDKYSIELPEFHATLPSNGMRVIVLPDPSTELVEVDVRYDVGSNEDPKGKAGLAHLVEHLMFQQRPLGPDKPPLWEVLRQMTLGVNAYTTWDSTHYIAFAKKQNLENLIKLEATRLYYGCKTIDQAEFERELEVVRNEMRFRLGSREGQLQYKLLEAIYPEGHPYRREVGGDDHELANITLEDVCRFMNDYYVPERATLIVAGNTTDKEVQGHVNQYLVPLPRRAGAPRRVVPPVDLSKKKIDLEFDLDEPVVFVAWAMPPAFTEADIVRGIIMGSVGGRTSFFGDRYDFATGVGVYELGGERAPVFVLEVRLRDSGKVGEALEAVWKSVRNAHRGFEKDTDFRDTRARVKGQITLAFESLGARTQRYGDYSQFDKEQKFFKGELKRIDTIRGDKIRERIESTLDPDKAIVMVVKTKAGAEGKYKRARRRFATATHDRSRNMFTATADDAKKPLVVPDKSSPLMKARRFQLGNGMKVVLLPTGSPWPIMAMQLIFQVGSVHESAARAGLAQATAELLNPPFADAGPGGDPTTADVLGMVGAQYGGQAGADRTTFTVRGLNIYDWILVKGLERFIKAGDYDQEQIEGWQKYWGFALKRKSVQDEIRYQEQVNAAIYGDVHPYVLTGDPRPETMARIGRDVAYDFKSSHYSARNATLVVVGSFDEKRVEKHIRDNFGDWSGGRQDQRVITAARARAAPLYVGVEAREELPTLRMTVAYPAPAGVDAQHAARMVLGDMLQSRVSSIRETLGATYGLGAGHVVRTGPGIYLVASGQVDADRAGEALVAIRAGLDELRQGKGFDLDFVNSRRKTLQDELTEITDSRWLATQLAFIESYGLEPDFHDKMVRQLALLSPAQVKGILAAELRPELEVIVLQGSRAKLEAAFQAMGATQVKWVQ
jgi:zinc protease